MTAAALEAREEQVPGHSFFFFLTCHDDQVYEFPHLYFDLNQKHRRTLANAVTWQASKHYAKIFT